MAISDKTVLMLAADLFEDMELLYPLYRLGEEGVAVTIALFREKVANGEMAADALLH